MGIVHFYTNGVKPANDLLSELQLAAQKGDELSTKDFQRLVKRFLDEGFGTPEDLALKFRVSVPTIHRWKETSAPHPLGRRSIIEGLIAKMTKPS